VQHFSRNGLTFDVVDSGPADGEVVILLHGFPQSADEWNHLVPILTGAGFRCLVPNQRGYSVDARPRGRRAYRVGELTADLAALVDASGAERVHVVGHDWGAVVAWAFANEQPHRVTTLTAVSVPHPAAFMAALGTSRQFLSSWYMYFFQLPRLPERFLLGRGGTQTKRLERMLVRGGQTPERAARDAAALVNTGSFTTAVNWYRAMAFTDPRRTRTRTTVPTLFMWSDGDHFITRAAAERCAAWVDGPYRFEVLEGVSHWIPEEAPQRAGELLLEHFAASTSGSPAS
jgi:pimeloyl-ACP methyl ester carboxylesterase